MQGLITIGHEKVLVAVYVCSKRFIIRMSNLVR